MRFLLPLFMTALMTALFSGNAFAIHAYRSENCKALNHTLDYKGNYPVGGMYGISLNSNPEEDTTALPLTDGEYTNTLDDAEVIFNELTSVVLEEKTPVNDCYFDHQEWTSEKVIEVKLISKDAAKKLGLNEGDKITFICQETTDYPNGNTCEDDSK